MPRLTVRNAVWTALVILVFAPGAAWAQTTTTGAIAGMVRDSTGGVLPGVTVEAASPALIERVRAVVTDGQGLYKIVDLRPGSYSVTFTLPGFSVFMRDGLELSTGLTMPVNAELIVGSVEETITVTGASPMVDVQNVRTQIVLRREILDSVPTFRTLPGFAAMLVGASLSRLANQDVGGSLGEGTTGISYHGSRGSEMRILLDGMSFQSLETRGAGVGKGYQTNQMAVEEVALATGTAESDIGGIQISMIPREGSNTFLFTGVVNYTNTDLHTSNLNDSLIARGLTEARSVKIKKIYDYGLGLGGPIISDKLWFYTSHRWWASSQFVTTDFNKTQGTFVYTPDVSRPGFTNWHNEDHGARFTWQASPKSKITISGALQNNCKCPFRVGENQSPEASAELHYDPSGIWSVGWTYPATSRLLFEVKGMVHNSVVNVRRLASVALDDIPVREITTRFDFQARKSDSSNTCSTCGGQHGLGMQVYQRATVSYVTGSHAFKVGLLVGYAYRNYINGEEGQGLKYFFRGGVPVSLTQYQLPTFNREVMFPNIGIYAQDQWTIDRLTLNLGVRFDSLNAHTLADTLEASRWLGAFSYDRVDNVPDWQDISPRLGAAYDLSGDGRTALKVSLGKYVGPEATNLARSNHPANTISGIVNRSWNDANGDFVADCDLALTTANGECGAMANQNFGSVKRVTQYSDDVLTGNRPYNWRASLAVQHELRQGVALEAGYYRTWFGNFTVTDNLAVSPADYDPYCITAPVDGRLPGGGGQEICGLYDINPSVYGRVDNLVVPASKFGTQTEVYNGFDVKINARFGEGGLLQGGFATGQTVTDNCDVVFDSPQKRFCNAKKSFAEQTQVKLSGVYPLPVWDILFSATLQNLAGLPITASFSAPNSMIAPSLGRNLASCGTSVTCRRSLTVNLIEPSTEMDPRFTQIDVRLTKIFQIGAGRIKGMFDFYNLTNASPVLQFATRFGSSWLRPNVVLPGRLVKFGVQWDF